MKFFNSFSLCVFLSVVAVSVTSCAEEQTETYNEFETMALEAWITQNRPDLIDNKQEPGGYYVDVLDAGDPDFGPVNDTVCWVNFGFTGRDLSGNIVLTRSAADAVLAGTFTKYTRYVPYYRFCGTQNTSLLEGTYLAMRNSLTLSENYYNKYKNDPERRLTSREVLLRKGSRVALYMPSRIVGSGLEGSGGYEGQYSLSAGRPLIVMMEIRDTIKNPLEAEGKQVDDFCDDNGGRLIYYKDKDKSDEENKKTQAPTDTTDIRHPYQSPERWVSACDSVAQLYVNYRFTPEETLNFKNPYFSGYGPYTNEGSVAAINVKIAEALKKRFYPGTDEKYVGVRALQADSVKLDGTAKIWYIGRFLDGFIFDTNIDEVKQIIYGEVTSKGTAFSYTPENGGMITAFYYTVPNLQYGQWAALITTSTNAYGASGQGGSTSTSSSGGSSSNSYYDYANYMNYMNSYYGNNGYYGGYYNDYYGGGYGGYGNGYYGGYYGGYGSNYGNTDSETTTTTVTTEVPSFAPLIFEFYIEPKSK